MDMLSRRVIIRPWVRWLVFIVLTAVLLIVVGLGVLYFKIKSISLEDIQKRQQIGQQSSTSIDGKQEVKAPSFLEGSIDKANQFADKPVKTQDALDAAAILLHSGLSIREIYYLTGQTTNNLSNEAKLRIRNLLLAKLTRDEIEALRSITSKYGKYLVILDPNYPIELVGVYDEAERRRIKKQLDEKKAGQKQNTSIHAQESAQAGSQAQQVQPLSVGAQAAAPSTSISIPISTPISIPISTSLSTQTSTLSSPPIVLTAPTASTVVDSEQNVTAKDSISSKYTAGLNALKADCEAKVHSLVAEMENSLTQVHGKDKETALRVVKDAYMNWLADAEEQCDSSFSGMISKAEQEYKAAGLQGDVQINRWKEQYNAIKTETRNRAFNELSQHINKMGK